MYLAMKGVKIPFRTRLPQLPNIRKAIRTFCLNYKKALLDNIDVLEYRDIVNYEELLKPGK
jgi:hypothetical protein